MALRGALGGGNDGLGSASSTATLTLPAGCQVGDVALFITVSNLGSTGTVTGTSPACVADSGPDVVSGNNSAYVMHRVLTAGDIAGGTIVITWNASGRILASGQVWSGLTTTGLVINHATTTSTPANLPTVTTTADNSQVVALTSARVSSGSAAVATFPAGYTTDNSAKTSFSSGVQFGCSAAHRTTTGVAGTYGGGSVSWSGTFSNANMYVVGMAPAAPTSTTYPASGTSSGASGLTGAVTALLLAAGTVAGVSGTSGAPTRVPRTYAASATVQATSATSGDVTRLPRTFPAAGVVVATSGTTGSVSVIGGPATLPAGGTVTATTTTAGTVTALLAAAGTTPVVAGVVGDVTVIVAPVTHQATGTVAATSSTSGAVTIWQPGQAPPDFTNPGALLKGNLATAMLTGNAAGAALAVNPAAATLHATTHNAVWRHPDMSKWKTGDTWPPLEITLTDAGQPVDLSTATAIAFHSAPKAPATITINAPMQPADPVNGVVRYLWQPGDLDEAGTFRAEAEVTWADGTIQTFPPDGYLSYTVADQLDAVTP